MLNYVGYNENGQGRWFKVEFTIPSKTLETLLRIGEKVTADTLRDFFEWLKTEKVVPTLECLMMFYKRADAKQLDFDMRIGQQEVSTKKNTCLAVEGKDNTYKWDVMGFVEKTLDYEEVFEENINNITSSLANAIIQYWENNSNTKVLSSKEKKIQELIHRKVKEQSIFNSKVIGWKTSQVAAFPFYDVDLSYNVIKRVRRELMKENPHRISYEKSYEYLCKLYNKIGDLLKDQEEFYNQLGLDFQYYDSFINCPYIKAFLNPKKYLNANFEKMLTQNIWNILNPVHLREQDIPV